MIVLTVTPDIEATPWLDLLHRDFANDRVSGDPILLERIGILSDGVSSPDGRTKRAAVEMMATLPDGRVVIVETSLRNFRMAAHALLASPIAVAQAESEGL